MRKSHLDRRTKYSLQAIRTALFDLLESKELKHITVTDVCKLADVNRGTFYKYYEDVPDLFAKIELSVAEETCETIRKNCLENFSVQKLLSNILAIIIENKDFTRMLTKNPTETRFLREIISSFRPQLIETMPANIPDLTTEICDMYFDFILGGTVNLLLQWIKKDMTLPASQMESLSIQFIHSVLGTKIYPLSDEN